MKEKYNSFGVFLKVYLVIGFLPINAWQNCAETCIVAWVINKF